MPAGQQRRRTKTAAAASGAEPPAHGRATATAAAAAADELDDGGAPPEDADEGPAVRVFGAGAKECPICLEAYVEEHGDGRRITEDEWEARGDCLEAYVEEHGDGGGGGAGGGLRRPSSWELRPAAVMTGCGHMACAACVLHVLAGAAAAPGLVRVEGGGGGGGGAGGGEAAAGREGEACASARSSARCHACRAPVRLKDVRLRNGLRMELLIDNA
jgi:hypothetical protein